MNILIFLQSQEVGGVDTILANILNSWPDRSDEFTIWYNKSYKGKHILKDYNIRRETITFPTYHELYAFIEGIRIPGVCKLISKGILRMSMCVIFWLSVLFFVIKLINKKFDVLFSDNGGYPAAELCLSIMIAGKISGIKKRFLIINSCPSPKKPFLNLLESTLDRLISWSSSEVITVSRACAIGLENLRFHGRQLKIIYNGISAVRADRMPLETKRKVLGIDPDNQVIGLIGDYEKLKGHEPLMRAFVSLSGKYPQARLVFIGSDAYEYSKYLKKMAAALNLEGRIIFTGYLENAREYIECFDVLVLPSIAYEGFGIVLLEAMLYKKPTIGACVGGIPEVLGDSGLIVKPDSYNELADAIDRLLSDPVLCAELAAKGFKRLNDRFTAARMAREYFELTRA